MSISNRVIQGVRSIVFTGSPLLYGRSSAGAGAGEEIIIGSGLDLTDGVLSSTGTASSLPWGSITGAPLTFPPAPHAHTKEDIGLGNVDNTSDVAKPLSAAALAAIYSMQPLDANLTAYAACTTNNERRDLLGIRDPQAIIFEGDNPNSSRFTMVCRVASGGFLPTVNTSFESLGSGLVGFSTWRSGFGNLVHDGTKWRADLSVTGRSYIVEAVSSENLPHLVPANSWTVVTGFAAPTLQDYILPLPVDFTGKLLRSRTGWWKTHSGAWEKEEVEIVTYIEPIPVGQDNISIITPLGYVYDIGSAEILRNNSTSQGISLNGTEIIVNGHIFHLTNTPAVAGDNSIRLKFKKIQ